MERQEIQKKLLKYQLLENKANALLKRREMLITKMIEIDSTLNSLEEIKKSGKEDILLPIGSGVHVKGTLKEVKKMVVELGANTTMETTIEETKKIVLKRKKILESGLTTLENEMVTINKELIELEPVIRSILSGINKPAG